MAAAWQTFEDAVLSDEARPKETSATEAHCHQVLTTGRLTARKQSGCCQRLGRQMEEVSA